MKLKRKGGDEMREKENAVIACEVKIGVTAKSWNEIQEMLRKIREACDFDHKLKINFDGEFFKNLTNNGTFKSKTDNLVEKKRENRVGYTY